MTEFKAGDKVFDILKGDIAELTKCPHRIYEFMADTYCSLTKEGKVCKGDKYPRFISLAEAKAKGYDVPVQKVKKSKTLIAVYVPSLNTKMLRAESQIDLPLPPDAITKEVTFEWEEDEQ